MGVLGDILYPDNKTKADDLNKKYKQLLDNNTLHNNLTNSYLALASSISTFDAYLMAVICMQYVIVYDDEKLANLPATDIPMLSQSIADRIQGLALSGVAVVQGLQGLNAMRKGVVNLYRNAGIYKAKIGKGYGAFKKAMQNGLDRVRLKLNSARSANVSSVIEKNPAKFKEMSIEMTEIKPKVLNEEEVKSLNKEEGLPEEGFEIVDAEVSEGATVTIEGAEVAEESVSAASALSEAGSALIKGFEALIGPAVLILIVVTEITTAVEAGKMNSKLKQAETDMDSNLKTQEDSIKTLKKAFGNLLSCAIQDIQEYNELIKDELSLSASKQGFFAGYRGYTPGIGFDYQGLDAYKSSLENIKDALTITVLQGHADSDLKDVTACITAQSIQDSKDAQIITSMKSWLKTNNKTDIDNDYIQELVDVFGVDTNRITYCNNLRQYMNEFAAKLEPYHKAINQEPQARGTQTKQPDKDLIDHKAKPDPTYKPDPNDFTTPPA